MDTLFARFGLQRENLQRLTRETTSTFANINGTSARTEGPHITRNAQCITKEAARLSLCTV